ncbi:MAG: HPF/RaiA family ribosome-associated protein [Candidatus Woesearchaeota archaeon]
MEEIKLGAKINLVGFKEIPKAEMQVVKKIVGHYLNNYEKYTDINVLAITLKIIHNSEKIGETKKYEFKAQLNTKLGNFHAEACEVNLFSAFDELLKKLETQLAREKEKSSY